MTHTVLHIDSSARIDGSISRDLTANILGRYPGADVITRDIGRTPLPQITDEWVSASFTPPEDRSSAQKDVLAVSDALVDELIAADTIVIGAPMYNFSVPAALKAWIDQVARPGRTFNYTADGPVGLLHGKRVIVAMATGGVPHGSDMDFAAPYLRFVLGFLGITDVSVVAADGANADEAAARDKAKASLDALFAA
ncbi:MAG: NAD(P)H-dependent oxidoreductase [Pseudomonadota bacterium]